MIRRKKSRPEWIAEEVELKMIREILEEELERMMKYGQISKTSAEEMRRRIRGDIKKCK